MQELHGPGVDNLFLIYEEPTDTRNEVSFQKEMEQPTKMISPDLLQNIIEGSRIRLPQKTRFSRLKRLVLRILKIYTRQQEVWNVEVSQVLEQIILNSDSDRELLNKLVSNLESIGKKSRFLLKSFLTLYKKLSRDLKEQKRINQRLESDMEALKISLHCQIGVLSHEIEEQKRGIKRLKDELEFETHRVNSFLNPGGAMKELYAVFEDKFRGTPEETKIKMSPYLAMIPEIEGIVADLGCGRGELLEICAISGRKVRGVDLNPHMVAQCKRKNLDVILGTFDTFLDSVDEGELSTIFSLHMIEHIPFAEVMRLLRKAYVKLAKGGKIILETPNVENLLVGANTFYMDPTHLRPVHPQTLEFLVSESGFKDVNILYLNPPEPSELIPGDLEVTQRMNALIYGPRDVTVIGTKYDD